MTIIEHISSGHRRQRWMIEALLAAPEATEESGRLFDILCDEVEAQAAAKEQTFYAALQRLGGEETLSRWAVESHDAIAMLIGAISDMAREDARRQAALQQLAEMLEAHSVAEAKLLSRAEPLIAADEAVRLGESYLTARDCWIDAFGRVPLSEVPAGPALQTVPAQTAPLYCRVTISRRLASVFPGRPRGWFRRFGGSLRRAPRGAGAVVAGLPEPAEGAAEYGTALDPALPSRGR